GTACAICSIRGCGERAGDVSWEGGPARQGTLQQREPYGIAQIVPRLRAVTHRLPELAARDSRVARRVREAVRAQLADGIARGVCPGAVAAVVQGRQRPVLEALGHAQVVPRRVSMQIDTVFDLASLTKPVATTTAILQLWEHGRIDHDAPVAHYLPDFAQKGKAAATIRHLLAHTSGLPAWDMLYLPGPTRGGGPPAPACRSITEAIARICATPAAAPPGTRIEYSDLGFILLGDLVERLSARLDIHARTHIFEPLGMKHTRFVPPRSWRARCAATEIGNAYERGRATEQRLGPRFRWRTTLLRGEVHDGNAWHLGRGVAGHAGLFGTASDLARFGRAMLAGGALESARILRRETVAEATKNHTPGLDSQPRGLGWALPGWPFLGTRASASAFGHTGFTGTSLVLDPQRDLAIVLLTNRVHPRVEERAGGGIVAFRPVFHDAVIEACDG
ncbi:MAG: serine hydrolase domain-containing protein, partial [bacterium]